MTDAADHRRGLELARAGRIDEAEAIFRTLLDNDPADAESLHFFAVLAGQREDFGEAERLLRQAVAARPTWAKGWNSLGKTYHLLGRMKDAAASYEQAIRYDPKEVRYHCDFGQSLRALGELTDAAEVLRRAAQVDPRSADAHTGLAAVLKDLNLNAESEAAAERAIEIDPHHAEAYNVLGNARRRLNRHTEAEANYRRAITLSPEVGLYHCNLANLLRNVGRLDEATSEFRRALDLDPDYTEPYRHLADLIPIAPGDPLCSRMEALLRSADTAPDRRVELRYALGKVFEAATRYDEAFHHWAEANRLKRMTIAYDDNLREETARQTIALFDREFLAHRSGSGNPSGAPIFIVGMPRSGTTLVEQILASHSAVSAGGELPVLGRIANAAGFPSGIADADTAVIRSLGDDYLAQAQPHGSIRFTDKMPGNFLRIGLIRLILPNARIVHCRRDPVDTCLSCFRQHFSGRSQLYSYDLRELGHEYRRYERLMDHWRTVVPGAAYELHYETLLDDAEGEIRRLLDYCDLPFEAACLRFHETDRPIETASATQVRRPLNQSARDRWKSYEAHLTPLLEILEI